MTYSLESAFVKAYSAVAVGVQCLLDAVGTLERITRPPVRHSGFDESLSVSPDGYYSYAEPDLAGAEQLAEREAETEVWEGTPRYCGSLQPGGPGLSYRCTRWLGHDGSHGYGGVFWEADEPPPLSDTPNPTEPGLTPDELVGVRGLLQERYGEPPLSDAEASRIVSDKMRQMRAEKRAQAAFVTAVQSSPVSTDLGGAHSVTKAGERPAGVDTAFPPAVPPAGTDLATWLEPAVQTILDAHTYKFGHDTNCECGAPSIWDWRDWQDHVAPIMSAHIAKAIETDWLDLTQHDLWAAGTYIDCWATSDNCDDRPTHQRHLHELATRLRDASRAMRDRK